METSTMMRLTKVGAAMLVLLVLAVAAFPRLMASGSGGETRVEGIAVEGESGGASVALPIVNDDSSAPEQELDEPPEAHLGSAPRIERHPGDDHPLRLEGDRATGR